MEQKYGTFFERKDINGKGRVLGTGGDPAAAVRVRVDERERAKAVSCTGGDPSN